MSFLLAISVGNTRTAVGHFHGDDLHVVQHLANGDVPAIVAAAVAQWEHKGEHDGEVVIASVNDALATAIEAKLASELHTDIWRVGRDIEVPVGRCLDEGATPGQDRLLAAAAAYAMMKQAVIVIDAGTAITVDFVDGEGVFHGLFKFRSGRLAIEGEETVAAENEDPRDAGDIDRPFGSFDDGVFDLGLLKERFHFVLGAHLAFRPDDHQSIVAMSLVHLGEMGEGRDTGRAVHAPILEHDDLALEFLVAVLFAEDHFAEVPVGEFRFLLRGREGGETEG